MSGSNISGCVSVLNQQRQQVTEHHNQCVDRQGVDRQGVDRQCSDPPQTPCDQPKSKKCTVVENGRVVVKLIVDPSQSDCTE